MTKPTQVQKWPLIVTTDEEIGQALNATIERCAQVAEHFPNAVEWQTIYTAGIAAAIRALKDSQKND